MPPVRPGVRPFRCYAARGRRVKPANSTIALTLGLSLNDAHPNRHPEGPRPSAQERGYETAPLTFSLLPAPRGEGSGMRGYHSHC
jgi:hypothetical protein